jgi:hypothetical protein
MLDLVDHGDAGLDEASNLFDRYGKDEDLWCSVAESEIFAPLPESRQMRDGMSFPGSYCSGPGGRLQQGTLGRRYGRAGAAAAIGVAASR